MAIDLNQAIQELLDSVNYQKKIQEQLFDIYLNPTPKTVTIYGPDGKALGGIPNVTKWRDVVWKDAQSAMSKIFYVDQVNGSDTKGDGSANAPFQTIEKARDSVPPNGSVQINLLSDYTIKEPVYLGDRKLVVNIGNNKLIFASTNDGAYKYIKGFKIKSARDTLILYGANCQIVVQDDGSTLPINPNHPSAIHFFISVGGAVSIVTHPNVSDKTSILVEVGSLLSFGAWSANQRSIGDVMIHARDWSGTNSGKIQVNSNAKLIDLAWHGVARLQFSLIGFAIVDEAGNTLTIPQVVANVKKKALSTGDAIPVNVISNAEL